jgi:hypothetical protein
MHITAAPGLRSVPDEMFNSKELTQRGDPAKEPKSQFDSYFSTAAQQAGCAPFFGFCFSYKVTGVL